MAETVKNTANRVVDLSDGRTLGIGEVAEDIPMNPHNRALVDDGHLTIVTTQPEQDEAPTATAPADVVGTTTARRQEGSK